MSLRQVLKPRVASILITIVLFILICILASSWVNFGGYNYIRIPFPAKVTSCGTSLQALESCTYPVIWGGVVLDIIFWLAVYALLSLICYKIKKKKNAKIQAEPPQNQSS